MLALTLAELLATLLGVDVLAVIFVILTSFVLIAAWLGLGRGRRP
jgi:hypothetical protein